MINQIDYNDVYSNPSQSIYHLNPNLFLFPFFILIGFLIYTLIYQFKKREIESRYLAIRLTLYSLLILVVIWIFAKSYVRIYITLGSNYDSNFIFTLFNGLIFGMFLNVCGFLGGSKGNSQKYLMLFVLLYFALSGFGYLGIRIYFDISIFNYKYYQTNSVKGIYFFLLNINIWILLYFLSFITEGSKK